MRKDHGIDCLLHDHADGARPIRNILRWLYEKNKKPIPFGVNLEDMILAKFINPHADIVEAFSNTTGLLQSEETLYEMARNHVICRADEGMHYDELMLAPHYHLFGEFKEEATHDPVTAMTRVINAVVEGIRTGERERPNIEVNMIAAFGRELRARKAIQILRAIERSDRNYVVGTNVVCDENKFPPERHRETFEYADAAEINFEFHAGEWIRRPKQRPDFRRDLPMLIKNIRFVLNLYRKSKSKTKKRIGHGIALPYDLDLIKTARDHQVGITGCPGSNLQGKNIPSLAHLLIKYLLQSEILWSMNPDDDFFQKNIDEVFTACDEVYHFNDEERLLMRINAWRTRFGNRKSVPEDVKYPQYPQYLQGITL